MRYFPAVVFFVFLFMQCRPKQPEYKVTEFPGKPEVPASIKEEHEYLLGKITVITGFQDSTGTKAKELKMLMENHFQEEEDFVLPPLGLLPSLSRGELPSESADVIQLIDKFESQSAHMSAEHQLIKALMEDLRGAAQKDGHPEVDALAELLLSHAQTEEQVLFPTVIFIGRYLKERSMPEDSQAP